MKQGVSQSPVQSDDAVNIHPSGAVSYATVAASWRPSCASCLLVKRGVLPVVASVVSAQARRCVQPDLCFRWTPCDFVMDFATEMF